MGSVSVKFKIMPESPAVNLEELRGHARAVILKHKGTEPKFTEEPIAFGLKAVYASFDWPEDKELEEVERDLGRIPYVKSAELSDIRRAVG